MKSAHTTTDTNISGTAQKPRNHGFTTILQLREVTNSIIGAMRTLDLTDSAQAAAILDLSHAAERVNNAIDHVRAAKYYYMEVTQ